MHAWVDFDHWPLVVLRFGVDGLERSDFSLNRLTLPEIKDFNMLSDAFCFRLKSKRFSIIVTGCFGGIEYGAQNPFLNA